MVETDTTRFELLGTGQGGSLKGQVVAELERRLGSESMRSDGRLPSERVIASDLRVSRNTVTAA